MKSSVYVYTINSIVSQSRRLQWFMVDAKRMAQPKEWLVWAALSLQPNDLLVPGAILSAQTLDWQHLRTLLSILPFSCQLLWCHLSTFLLHLRHTTPPTAPRNIYRDISLGYTLELIERKGNQYIWRTHSKEEDICSQFPWLIQVRDHRKWSIKS